MDNEKKSGPMEVAASEKHMLLKNGLIVDGTGTEGFMGNLLIKGGRIE
jgi:N-acyl-D-aspartate/D-glutamate deacylase